MVIPRTGYLQIANDLQDQIAAGKYAPGEQISTYAQLAADYGVSVTTVQSALRILRARGILVGVQGRGVYVAEAKPKRRGR